MTPIDEVLLGLSLLTLLIISIQGMTVPLTHGWHYGLGNRDEAREPTAFMRRCQRVLDNHLQALAMALPLLILASSGPLQANAQAALGAWIFLGARIAFTTIYLIGIPYLRSLSFGIGLAGLVVMLLALV
ncbi:MAG: MAPEG family protein [Pseudomonadales bacterium]|nr:MAPEG family protein [Pseudomonadales bacterium]